jgi:hypothetical protein
MSPSPVGSLTGVPSPAAMGRTSPFAAFRSPAYNASPYSRHDPSSSDPRISHPTDSSSLRPGIRIAFICRLVADVVSCAMLDCIIRRVVAPESGTADGARREGPQTSPQQRVLVLTVERCSAAAVASAENSVSRRTTVAAAAAAAAAAAVALGQHLLHCSSRRRSVSA